MVTSDGKVRDRVVNSDGKFSNKEVTSDGKVRDTVVTSDLKVRDKVVTSDLMDVTPSDSTEVVGARQPRDSIDGLTDNLAWMTSHVTLDLCSLPLSSSLQCLMFTSQCTVHCSLLCTLCNVHCPVH